MAKRKEIDLNVSAVPKYTAPIMEVEPETFVQAIVSHLPEDLAKEFLDFVDSVNDVATDVTHTNVLSYGLKLTTHRQWCDKLTQIQNVLRSTRE